MNSSLSLPRRYAFRPEEGRIWIYIFDTIEVDMSEATALISWGGEYMVTEQHGKELVPIAKYRLPNKVVEVHHMVVHKDGGTLCQVDADILDRSKRRK